MVQATKKELHAIGVTETPGVAVADSGYWNEGQIDNVVRRWWSPCSLKPSTTDASTSSSDEQIHRTLRMAPNSATHNLLKLTNTT